MEKVKEFVDYLNDRLTRMEDTIDQSIPDCDIIRNTSVFTIDHVKNVINQTYDRFSKKYDTEVSNVNELFNRYFKDIPGVIGFDIDPRTNSLFVYTSNVLEIHKTLKDNGDKIKSACPNVKRITTIYGIVNTLED